MRQFNAKLTICPRDQAGAVERIRSLGAPNVRATDTRASVGIRGAIVSRGAAAARIDDGASAATVAAAIIAAALVAAIVASAALVAAAVTAGSCSCSLRLCLCLGSRCGSGRSLLLLKQGTRLFVEGIHKVGGVLHLDLNLIVDLLAFRSLLGSDLLLTRKFVFSRLKLLASGLGLVDQISVVGVDLVKQLPILRELGKRGSTQQKIDERGGAGAVHAAGARAPGDLADPRFPAWSRRS